MTSSKRLTLNEAVALVPDGATLGLGGVTLYRRPMAFVLALRQRFAQTGSPHGLTLLAFTAGLESDLLVAAGMAARTRTCYFGLEAFGLAPAFTQAVGEGRLQVVEETEASLAFGLRAALAGVGFMPSSAWQGTDLLRLRPDVPSIQDPYTGETLTAFPAVRCDVAVVHALEADEEGNARIGGNPGVDPDLALVAGRVIVTAERVVPRLEQADLIGPTVHAVVEAPEGAWPTSCHPLYPLDGLALLDYVEAYGTPALGLLLDAWAARHAAAPASGA